MCIRDSGYARDFLDVDSIRASGKFTDAELIRSAIERDPGFEVPMFVRQLELVHRVLPEQVSQYNVDADQLDAIKNRFDVWASTLVEGPEDYGQVNRSRDTWLGLSLIHISEPTRPY